MKKILIRLSIVAAVLVSTVPSWSADTAPDKTAEKKPASALQQLQKLVDKINSRLVQGKNTEQDLAAELKEFDTLLAEHKGEKTDDVAHILFMKRMLYKQVFNNAEKAEKLGAQLVQEFPNSQWARTVAEEAMFDAMLKAKNALVVGSKFPDFYEKDLNGKPMSVSNYTGKVVLVDIWATWCLPCRLELPNVLAAYTKYHAKGFEVLGISLDQDRNALTAFITENKMPWQQFFDGQPGQNRLATKYGAITIPATYLLDGKGMIIAKDLRGEDLEKAVAEALAKK